MTNPAVLVPAAATGIQSGVSRRTWVALGFAFPALMLAILAQPSLRAVPQVSLTLLAAAALLAGWFAVLLYRSGRTLTVRFVPLAPHYVQACVQFSIYVYWGWYWRPVYDNAGLIAAQILLAYSLDMLLSLSRRGQWTLGFGPFPIIFSTNLFLLFRPEWFYLQFVMVTVGIVGKEFIRWQRDGRNTHVFNPSALSLFVFSILLIVTGTTDWSFAQEIATTLNRAPNIYLQIFLLGLIVQGLFSVTLVTLMSALALIVLNLAYTRYTGTYYFIDSNIPIAVFLGLHLLITDPATSPRTALGKAIFGLLYGAGVFLLYGLLGALGVPTFYDKLLCVPVLNLLVPWIDAIARRLRAGTAHESHRYSDISTRANRLHMVVWVVVFGGMFATSFVGHGHPGNDIGFWRDACDRDLHNGCKALYQINRNNCSDGNAAGCAEAAVLARRDPALGDALELGKLLSRSCDLGRRSACEEFRAYVRAGGQQTLEQACSANDETACLISGMVSMFGLGTAVDAGAALASWDRGCDQGAAGACSFIGEAYLLGKNVAPDPAIAAAYLATACNLGHQGACTTLGQMYQRGHGLVRDPEKGKQLIERACASGWQAACSSPP